MKIKRLSMRAISCLLTILMLTGVLALPMSVSAAGGNVNVSVAEGCEGMGTVTINGEEVSSATIEVGQEVTIAANPVDTGNIDCINALKKWSDGATEMSRTFTVEAGKTYNFTAEFAKKYRVERFFYGTGTSASSFKYDAEEKYAFPGDTVKLGVKVSNTNLKVYISNSLVYGNARPTTVYPEARTGVLTPGVDYEVEYHDTAKQDATFTVYDFKPALEGNGSVTTYALRAGSNNSVKEDSNPFYIYVDDEQYNYSGYAQKDGIQVTYESKESVQGSTLVLLVKRQNPYIEYLPIGRTDSTKNFLTVYHGNLSSDPIKLTDEDYYVEDVDELTRRITIRNAYFTDSSYKITLRINFTAKKTYNVNLTAYNKKTGEQIGSTVTKQESFLEANCKLDYHLITSAKVNSGLFNYYQFDHWTDDASMTDYVVDTSKLKPDDTIDVKAYFRDSKTTYKINPGDGSLGNLYLDGEKLTKIRIIDFTHGDKSRTLEAKPNGDLNGFCGWTDGETTSATRTLSFVGERQYDIEAVFGGPSTMSLKSSDGRFGSVCIKGEEPAESVTKQLKPGTSYTFEAVPVTSIGKFQSWVLYVDGVETKNIIPSNQVTSETCTFLIESDKSYELVAKFKAQTYSVSASVVENQDYKSIRFKDTEGVYKSSFGYYDTAILEYEPGDTVEKWYFKDDVDQFGNPNYHYPEEGAVTREYVVKGSLNAHVVSIGKKFNVVVKSENGDTVPTPSVYEAGCYYKATMSEDQKPDTTYSAYLVQIGDVELPGIKTVTNDFTMEFYPKDSNGKWLQGDMVIYMLGCINVAEMFSNYNMYEGRIDIITDDTLYSDGTYYYYYKQGHEFSFYVKPDEEISDVYDHFAPKSSLFLQYTRYQTLGDKIPWDNGATYERVKVDVNGSQEDRVKITVDAKHAYRYIRVLCNKGTIKTSDSFVLLDTSHDTEMKEYDKSFEFEFGNQPSFRLKLKDDVAQGISSYHMPQKIKITTASGKVIPESEYSYSNRYDYNRDDIGVGFSGYCYYEDLYIEPVDTVNMYHSFLSGKPVPYVVDSPETPIEEGTPLDEYVEGHTTASGVPVPFGKDLVLKFEKGKVSLFLQLHYNTYRDRDKTQSGPYSVTSLDLALNSLQTRGVDEEGCVYFTIPGKSIYGQEIIISETGRRADTSINGTYTSPSIFYEGSKEFTLGCYNEACLPAQEDIVVSADGVQAIEGKDYEVKSYNAKSFTIVWLGEDTPSSLEFSCSRQYRVYIPINVVYNEDHTKVLSYDLYDTGESLIHNMAFVTDFGMPCVPHSFSLTCGVVKDGKLVKRYGEIPESKSSYEETISYPGNGYKANKEIYSLAVQNYAVRGDIILWLNTGTQGDYHGGLKQLSKSYGNCANTKKVYYYYCSDCDEYYSDSKGTQKFDPTQYTYTDHQLKHVDAVDGETCLDHGTYAHYVCTVCGKTFYDPDANQKMPNPGKHQYVPYWSWVKSDSSSNKYDAYLQNRCKLCGHIEEFVKAKNVTYTKTEDGKYVAHAEAELFGKEYTSSYTFDVGYTVEVKNGYITSGQKENYGRNDLIMLKADATSGGKVFDGWYEGDVKIANTTEYAYFVKGNAVVEAKYVESLPEVTDPVFRTITGSRYWRSKDSGTTRVSATIRWQIEEYVNGKHYYIAEAGVMRSFTNSNPTVGDADGKNVVKYASNLKCLNGTYTYNVNMGASSLNKTLYVRGYVKYMDFNTGETFYAYTDTQAYNKPAN